MSADPPTVSLRRGLRVCAWCVAAVAVEIGLYASYRGHDARFHWFTHFFVGASAALLVMAVVAAVRRRPVPLPLVWVLVGHLVAMAPDLAFVAGEATAGGWTCSWATFPAISPPAATGRGTRSS
jgi:hypothetical protein